MSTIRRGDIKNFDYGRVSRMILRDGTIIQLASDEARRNFVNTNNNQVDRNKPIPEIVEHPYKDKEFGTFGQTYDTEYLEQKKNEKPQGIIKQRQNYRLYVSDPNKKARGIYDKHVCPCCDDGMGQKELKYYEHPYIENIYLDKNTNNVSTDGIQYNNGYRSSAENYCK